MSQSSLRGILADLRPGCQVVVIVRTYAKYLQRPSVKMLGLKVVETFAVFKEWT